MSDKTQYKKIKTKSYDRAAVDRYNAKFDRITLNLPKGTKERMEAVGMSAGDRVQAIINELEKREAEKREKP